MPLVKRLISPIELGRIDRIDPHIRNELELVANHSLANVIRQLSSLSRNAEDMFTELSGEASRVFERARTLQDRVGKLQYRVTQLDATVEEVSLHDINLRKPYRSTAASDQQVVARNTIPTAVVATYLNSEPPPPLAKLDIYREDNKSSIKFYTDPGYFFELWYSQIQKDIEQRKRELKEKKQHKRRPRAPQDNKEIRAVKTRRDEFKDLAKGVEFATYQTPQIEQMRPNSLEVKVPAGMTKIDDQYRAHPGQQQRRSHANSRVMNGPTRASHNEPTPAHPHPPSADLYNGSPDHRRPVRSPAGPRIHRPGQAPPAPPGMHQPDSTPESLPPPPPAPGDPHMMGYMNHESPHNNAVPHSVASPAPYSPQQHQQLRGPSESPPLAVFSRPHDDYLPPPPPSPPRMTPPRASMSPDMMPPPPSPPPPPLMFDNSPVMAVTDPRELSPPPPPPPPMANNISPPPPPPAMSLANGGLANALKSVSLSPVKEPPVVEEIDERSALLQEIRLGMWNLKTVAETQRREQKQPTGQLDVQTIMDRAFEMRRKAMEDSEEEEEEEGSDDEDWDTYA